MKKLLLSILMLALYYTGQAQSSEMLTNGSFATSDSWTLTSVWTISDDSLRYDATANNFVRQYDADMALSIEASTEYTFTFDAKLTGTANFDLYSTDVVEYLTDYELVEGSNTIVFTTPAEIGDGGIAIYGRNTYGYPFVIDNLSLVKNAIIGDQPYYVAVDGDDTASGDIDHPWQSWGRAFSVAQAGDTVYFRAGIWYKPVDGNIADNFDTRDGSINSGTEGNRICFFAYPPDLANGDSVIYDCRYYTPDEPDYDQVDLDNTGHTYNVAMQFWLADYLHFKGFKIRNVWQTYRYVYTQGMVFYACKNNIIENCTVENIGGIGFRHDNEDSMTRDVDSTYFINCDAYHCIDSLATNLSYYSIQKSGTWAHGFNSIIMKPGDYVEFNGCRATMCTDDGWNAQGFGTHRYINTWSFNNGVYLPFPDDYTSGNGYKMNTPLTTAYFSERLLAYPNLVSHYMTNCIAAFNKGYGMTENAGIDINLNRKVYNNTSVYNWVGFTASKDELISEYDDGRNNEYKNNIAYGNKVTNFNSLADVVTSEYNTWDVATGITVTDNDFINTDSATIINQLSALRNADGSLPTITAITLSSGSDLIDAGIDVGLPYNNTAPDIGYAEYDDAELTAMFSYSPSSPDINETVSIDGSLSWPSSTTTITAWSWDFGDGQSGSGETTTHSYSTAATYTVILTVTDSQSNTDQYSANITVVQGSSGSTAITAEEFLTLLSSVDGGGTLQLQTDTIIGDVTINYSGTIDNPIIVTNASGIPPRFLDVVDVTGDYVNINSAAFNDTLRITGPLGFKLENCTVNNSGLAIDIVPNLRDHRLLGWSFNNNTYPYLTSKFRIKNRTLDWSQMRIKYRTFEP